MSERARTSGAFRCPKCGTVTSRGKSFCVECGEALDIECTECEKTWRYMFNYVFCPSCGTKLKGR